MGSVYFAAMTKEDWERLVDTRNRWRNIDPDFDRKVRAFTPFIFGAMAELKSFDPTDAYNVVRQTAFFKNHRKRMSAEIWLLFAVIDVGDQVMGGSIKLDLARNGDFTMDVPDVNDSVRLAAWMHKIRNL